MIKYKFNNEYYQWSKNTRFHREDGASFNDSGPDRPLYEINDREFIYPLYMQAVCKDII